MTVYKATGKIYREYYFTVEIEAKNKEEALYNAKSAAYNKETTEKEDYTEVGNIQLQEIQE